MTAVQVGLPSDLFRSIANMDSYLENLRVDDIKHEKARNLVQTRNQQLKQKL